MFYQSCHSSIENCRNLSIYKLIKTEFAMEEYLLKNINVKVLSYLRYGVLQLNVETGRYNNQPRNERVCVCCTMQCIENEYHFTLICPTYRQLRLNVFPRYYCS